MELEKIEALIEKYFEGQTSIEQENQLKDYFQSSDLPPHLIQYKELFTYFDSAGSEKSDKPLYFQVMKSKNSTFKWISIAAIFLVLLAISFPYLINEKNAVAENVDSPEMAFQQTQKALALLSRKVNTGMKSVDYIGEYQIAKDRIFITN